MGPEKSLGPLGQITPTYTLSTLGFPIENKLQEAAAISTLEKAAREIIQAYPWLAGQVINEGFGDGNSGTYKIVRYEPHETPSTFVHVKDCTDDCPTYADLVKARAPVSMLDGSILSPAYGFVNDYPRHVVKPVCIMQANIVRGGLLLTICTFHGVMDANGNDQFIRQFGSLCRGEKLADEYVRWGNMDADTIVPPLKPGEEPLPMEWIRYPSTLSAEEPTWPPPPSKGTWRTFRFHRSSISALKAEAMKLCSETSDVKYVSSNDTVSTFIWLRIAAARSSHLPKDSKTMVLRAVNGRQKLDIPIHEGYMGHAVMCTLVQVPLDEALNESLSAMTIKLRRSLSQIDDHAMRSFFHLLQTEKDKTTINYGASMNMETDIMLSSWVSQKLYDTDFGDSLGKPDFVRRPKLPDAPSLAYMMPLTRDGDIDLVISLSDQDYEALRADAKWEEFVECLG
ncbi:hypothetical protein V495_07598 [Pseudogymnoascus sp. VKM F-4514 (FW-929)]|nr:hypothetical protein V490_02010 [Pseudogymnoascus sp. VKM F-3557]KFY36820.1 hypothetical protein V495_07598 [Pseudogymnoascus sp. VKM F-4514 (FW-929)]KFY55733.1 hypothetical protein V497_06761 [Pseudogymnoascus sp. VKM F-4516 (FW-969)]